MPYLLNVTNKLMLIIKAVPSMIARPQILSLMIMINIGTKAIENISSPPKRIANRMRARQKVRLFFSITEDGIILFIVKV